MPDSDATAEALIHAARRYAEARVPFRHQGRTSRGLDCIGLIVCAARDIGIDLPDRRDYARDPAGNELEQALDETCQRIAAPEPGAVVLIRFRDAKRHVGIITPYRMIHCWDLAEKVCEHSYHDWFRVRTVRLYRIPGLWPS